MDEMTTLAELELAIIHLKRAEELARFYHRTPETISKISLLKRAAINVQSEISSRASVPVSKAEARPETAIEGEDPSSPVNPSPESQR